MKRILITIANHVYDFEIDVAHDGIPNTVHDYFMDLRGGGGYRIMAACNLIYDVTTHTSVKSRYDERDLTKEAIDILFRTSKEITAEDLHEALYKAYPTL